MVTQFVPEGRIIPRGHGIAYRTWKSSSGFGTITAPIPLNLFVGLWHWIFMTLRFAVLPMPVLDQIKQKCYLDGHVHGTKSATELHRRILDREREESDSRAVGAYLRGYQTGREDGYALLEQKTRPVTAVPTPPPSNIDDAAQRLGVYMYRRGKVEGYHDGYADGSRKGFGDCESNISTTLPDGRPT